ncbi:hypothetical protein CDO52_20240 [Nocardiopsis gilva YIM 90087]|uniref:Uncharacterized protein n=1 Tax=Nocardiopsis gilva YIM 90087 TaxID=1235441 RepID=A0A223S9L7_9ACTN|nr:hypothetical protein [Nocardiopsis gilva]ASU84817.1 hypothetical protein CDO52_20240 [Nocardiopsis gilva YIM 90087]
MTDPYDEGIDERLSAILRAEADSVMPSPEGLEKIRARTEQRRVWSTFGLPWIRPVLAVGAAALIAGSVLIGTPQVRDQLLPSSLTSPTGPSDITRERDSGDRAAGELDGPVASDSGTRGQNPEQSPSPTDPEAGDASPGDGASGDGAATAAACPPGRTPSGRPSKEADKGDGSDDTDGGQASGGDHDGTDCVPTQDPENPDDTGGNDPDGTDTGGDNGDQGSGGEDGTDGATPSPGTNTGDTNDASGETPVPATGTPEM